MLYERLRNNVGIFANWREDACKKIWTLKRNLFGSFGWFAAVLQVHVFASLVDTQITISFVHNWYRYLFIIFRRLIAAKGLWKSWVWHQCYHVYTYRVWACLQLLTAVSYLETLRWRTFHRLRCATLLKTRTRNHQMAQLRNSLSGNTSKGSLT